MNQRQAVQQRDVTEPAAKATFLSHFSRVTTPERVFIPEIDGLRCVAIMAVIAYHVFKICAFHFGQSEIPNNWVSHVFATGHYGVELFFTISGFVLALPFARAKLSPGGKPTRLSAYYLRRLTRLEPPYIIHLLILFLATCLVYRNQPTHPQLYHNPDWLTYASRHILSSLFYSHGFIFGDRPYPNVVLWSLEAEVQFYIVAPFIAAVFLVSPILGRRSLLIGLMIGIPLIVAAVVPAELVSRILLINTLQYFLGGFLLADLHLAGALRKNTVFTWRAASWDALFLIVCLGIVSFPDHQRYILPCLTFLLCVAAFKGWFCSRVLSNQWITTVGGMCYTIYMYHSLIISGAIRVTSRLQTHVLWLDYLVQMVLCTALILPVCALLFVALERPFMQSHWPTQWRDAIRRKFR